MSFKLTPEVVHSIFDPTAEGNWSPFLAAIEENVHWIVNDPSPNPPSLAGTYNLQQWKDKVGAAFFMKLAPPGVQMKMNNFDIIGQKLILEASGSATQKNGKPYDNRFCWILIFSEETGKIVTIREYMNTALVQEVMESNP